MPSLPTVRLRRQISRSVAAFNSDPGPTFPGSGTINAKGATNTPPARQQLFLDGATARRWPPTSSALRAIYSRLKPQGSAVYLVRGPLPPFAALVLRCLISLMAASRPAFFSSAGLALHEGKMRKYNGGKKMLAPESRSGNEQWLGRAATTCRASHHARRQASSHSLGMQ